jgi:hypothetical protein
METWRSMEKSIAAYFLETFKSHCSRDLKVFKKKNMMLFSMDLHVCSENKPTHTSQAAFSIVT